MKIYVNTIKFGLIQNGFSREEIKFLFQLRDKRIEVINGYDNGVYPIKLINKYSEELSELR